MLGVSFFPRTRLRCTETSQCPSSLTFRSSFCVSVSCNSPTREPTCPSLTACHEFITVCGTLSVCVLFCLHLHSLRRVLNRILFGYVVGGLLASNTTPSKCTVRKRFSKALFACLYTRHWHFPLPPYHRTKPFLCSSCKLSPDSPIPLPAPERHVTKIYAPHSTWVLGMAATDQDENGSEERAFVKGRQRLALKKWRCSRPQHHCKCKMRTATVSVQY